MTLGDDGRLRAVVSAVVLRAGFDLEELTVIAAGRRRLVRVAIDRDGGVDLDSAAAVSRDISHELDADGGDEILGGAPYTLEVTSPGIGRPLTEARHFRRAAGRLVSVTLADGGTVQARILRVDGDTVVLLTGPDGLQQRSVPLAGISRAKVEVEFGPPPAGVVELLAGHGVAGPLPDGGPRAAQDPHPAEGPAEGRAR